MKITKKEINKITTGDDSDYQWLMSLNLPGESDVNLIVGLVYCAKYLGLDESAIKNLVIEKYG